MSVLEISNKSNVGGSTTYFGDTPESFGEVSSSSTYSLLSISSQDVDILRRQYNDNESGLFTSLLARQLGFNKNTTTSLATLIWKDAEGIEHIWEETASTQVWQSDGSTVSLLDDSQEVSIVESLNWLNALDVKQCALLYDTDTFKFFNYNAESIKPFMSANDSGLLAIDSFNDEDIRLVAFDSTSTNAKIMSWNYTNGLNVDGEGAFTSTVSGSDPVNSDDFVTLGYADLNYLGITDKAADSDLLDGHDSSYFATASDLTGYLPLTAGSSYPLTNTLYGTGASFSGDLQLGGKIFFNSSSQGIFGNTSDGSDNFRVNMCAGGALGNNRGGYVSVFGNEEGSSRAGQVLLVPGVGKDVVAYSNLTIENGHYKNISDGRVNWRSRTYKGDNTSSTQYINFAFPYSAASYSSHHKFIIDSYNGYTGEISLTLYNNASNAVDIRQAVSTGQTNHNIRVGYSSGYIHIQLYGDFRLAEMWHEGTSENTNVKFWQPSVSIGTSAPGGITYTETWGLVYNKMRNLSTTGPSTFGSTAQFNDDVSVFSGKYINDRSKQESWFASNGSGSMITYQQPGGEIKFYGNHTVSSPGNISDGTVIFYSSGNTYGLVNDREYYFPVWQSGNGCYFALFSIAYDSTASRTEIRKSGAVVGNGSVLAFNGSSVDIATEQY